jgi:hypothetical protein
LLCALGASWATFGLEGIQRLVFAAKVFLNYLVDFGVGQGT